MTPLLHAAAVSLEARLAPSDLLMEAPELVCLIGPNGSGKTSLLHALARIGSPGGIVRIDGIRPEELPPARRKRLVSFLPASRDVAWPLTVSDLVRLGLPDGAADREAQAAIAALELESFAPRRIDRLSTGERSRVLIARALAPRPRLLLLDEPVANLDPLWQLRLMDRLSAAVREQSCGVVVAMHDLDLAGRYADRLVLMERGTIVGQGEPRAMLASQALEAVFGIERAGGVWQPLSRPGDRRSSP